MPTFPIEIFENLIDILSFDHSTLKACALVCKYWYPRSRYHLLRHVLLFDGTQTARFAKLIRQGLGSPPIADVGGMVKEVVFKGVAKTKKGPRGATSVINPHSVAHVGTFAAMLARKLPRLSYLGITAGSWVPGEMYPDVHLHLSVFTSVTWLDIYSVTFPSVADFGRLVFALPSLQRLSCWSRGPMFSLPDSENYLIPALFRHKGRKTQIAELYLNGGHSARTLVAFFVFTDLATQLTTLSLGYYEHMSAGDIRPLIEAAEALRTLDITFTDEDFRPRVEAEGLLDSFCPLTLSKNTNLISLTMRAPLLAEPYDFGWLVPFLSQITSKLQEVMLVMDLRSRTDVDLLDKASAALPPFLCFEIEKVICSELDPQTATLGSEKDPAAATRAAQETTIMSEQPAPGAGKPQPRFPNLVRVLFPLWVTAAPGVPTPAAIQWAGQLAPRFRELCRRRIIGTPVVVQDWMGTPQKAQ